MIVVYSTGVNQRQGDREETVRGLTKDSLDQRETRIQYSVNSCLFSVTVNLKWSVSKCGGRSALKLKNAFAQNR